MFSPTLVHDYLIRSSELLPDKHALICGDERWTYREIDAASTHLAAILTDLGVKRNDRVAILLDNSPEAVISLYGTLKAGGIFILLESTLKAAKLRYILQDSGASVLIAHVNKAEVVGEALARSGVICRLLWVGDRNMHPGEGRTQSLFWSDVMNRTVWSNVPLQRNSAAGPRIDYDLATIIYTSGSTGEPKGVMCPHYNMVSVSQCIIQYLGNSRDDVLLNVLPLSFGYGLYQVLTTVMIGGTVVLERSFAYPVKVLERFRTEQITGFAMVPTIVALMLRIKNLEKYDFSSLRYITNAAAALPMEHLRKLRALLPHVDIFPMYGLTECARVSYLAPRDVDKRPDSVGKAIPNCEVIILDEQGGETGPGEVGELVVRGTNVMRGYWNAPELTSKIFRQGRFPGERLLYSGDLFKKDGEGYLYFVGRKDDMIKVKGERVSPLEVENVLCKLDGVAESAVIGIPDEILGQSVKAFIVINGDRALTEKKVLKHCSESLQSFMVPKYVEFVDSLPKSPNGKIDKKILRSTVEKGLGTR